MRGWGGGLEGKEGERAMSRSTADTCWMNLPQGMLDSMAR